MTNTYHHGSGFFVVAGHAHNSETERPGIVPLNFLHAANEQITIICEQICNYLLRCNLQCDEKQSQNLLMILDPQRPVYVVFPNRKQFVRVNHIRISHTP